MGRARKLEGVQVRKGDPTRYRGTAYIHGRQERGPWTADPEQAIVWRQKKLDEARTGGGASERVTFGRAVDIFTAGIASGAIRNRSGRRFKPSVIRDYTRHLALLKGIVGVNTHLDTIHLRQADDVLERLRGMGHSDSWVRNVMSAFRSMCRWAIPKGYMNANPVQGLSMPITDERARERVAGLAEARLLLGALEFPHRTILALGCYAGMRAGEILSLEWANVDLERPMIRVDQSVDLVTGELIAPKSKAAHRDIPICDPLLVILEDHQDSYNRTGALFPALRPRRGEKIREGARMSHSGAVAHMRRRWKAIGLEPLGLHEARHTFASVMIDAGATPKAVQTYMGHSSIQVTYDRYGHLMPGHEAEALRLLNAYHETGVA